MQLRSRTEPPRLLSHGPQLRPVLPGRRRPRRRRRSLDAADHARAGGRRPPLHRPARPACPGIAPNLLADRLRDLQAEGLVEHKELPPPAARTVYASTKLGRRADPGAAVAGPLRRVAPRAARRPSSSSRRSRSTGMLHAVPPPGARRRALPRPSRGRRRRRSTSSPTATACHCGGARTRRPTPSSRCSARDLVAARQGLRDVLSDADPGAPGSAACSSWRDGQARAAFIAVEALDQRGLLRRRRGRRTPARAGGR